MKGLIIKDLILIRKYNAKIILLFSAVYLAVALFSRGEGAPAFTVMGTVWILLFSILPMSTFSCDKIADWERYALSMPVTRDTIVKSKYLLTAIFLLAGSALSFLCLCLSYRAQGAAGVKQAAAGTLFNAGGLALMMMILLPLIFRFGAERARMLMMVLAVAFTAALGAFTSASGGKAPSVGSPFLPVIVLLAVAVAAAVSYEISVAIYRRQEVL